MCMPPGALFCKGGELGGAHLNTVNTGTFRIRAKLEGN